MLKNKFLMTLIGIFLISSCGTFKEKQNSKENNSKFEKKANEETQKKTVSAEDLNKQVRNHLDGLIKSAIKEGDASVRFLATDLFIKAMDSSLNGDSYSASFLLEHALKLRPEDLYIQKKYGVELIKIGSIEKALPVVLNIVKKTNYNDESFSLILAGVYTALNKPKLARKTYNKMISIHPNSVEGCTFLGKSLIETKEYKKAKIHFNKCLARIKNEGIFSLYLGKIAAKEEKQRLALKYYKKALKLSPNLSEAALLMGSIYESSSREKRAVKIYKRFLDKNSENFAVLTKLVEVLFKFEKYKEVVQYAEALLAIDNSNLNLKVRLGIIYTDFKKYNLAKGIFREILTVIPDSDKVLYYLGSLYQQTGEMESAIDNFSKIQKESTLYNDSSLQIAQILRLMAQNDRGEYTKRFLTYSSKKASEVKELKVDLHVFMAGHYEQEGKLEDAIKKMKTIESEEKFTDDHNYFLASLYEKVGKYKESELIINDILKRNPDNPSALNFLGYSLLERGNELDRAYRLIKKAVTLRPKDGYINDSMGWYFYKVGKYKEALTHLKKAVSLVEADPVVTRHLAEVYAKLKNYNMAQTFLLKALDFSPSEEEKIVIQKSLKSLEKKRLPASVKKK